VKEVTFLHIQHLRVCMERIRYQLMSKMLPKYYAPLILDYWLGVDK
jgi:hypothetical protein